MDEVQRCRVERVIREVIAKNKDKSPNEIKRIVKNKIRIKKGNQRELEENMKLISEINSELIESIIVATESKKGVIKVYIVDSNKENSRKGR